MQHKDRLTDEERKARRLESARKYREANREKVKEACRVCMAKKREDQEFRKKEQSYKQDPGYQERQREYRAANREVLNAKTFEWRAKNPEAFAEYQRNYWVANRPQTRARLVEWRKNNPDRSAQYGRQWRADNPGKHAIHEQNRRARKQSSGGELSPDLYVRLMKLQSCRCAACKEEFGKRKAHLDHIMPIARGGSNTDDNIQLLCQACNNSKHAKHPVDFMQERGFLL